MDIAKDLSKACMNKKYQYHNKDLGKRNKCILDFCLNTFQLAFLGELLLETKKETYDLEYFQKIWSRPFKENSEDTAKKEWERYKSEVKQVKEGRANYPWLNKAYELDEYDELTDTATHYEKVYVSNVVVSNGVMEHDFNRYHFSNGPDSEDTIKARVANIVKFAKDKLNRENGKTEDFIEPIDIYRITKDTIDNTRNLISQGYRVDLEKWEDLDMLDAKLDSGDAIFYVRIAHEGDGYGDFYIYCEDDADGLNGVSGIEILTSDCL